MIIQKKRIFSIDFIEDEQLEKIKIGIHVTKQEYIKLGIQEFKEGLIIQPSPNIGINCKRNVYGESFPDKTQPKIKKAIGTRYWELQDWGGHWHSGYSDIIRDVYPRIEITPQNIEFILVKNFENEEFIIANIIEKDRENIKFTINLFLEIFGFCEIFNDDLELLTSKTKYTRCNWTILPPGVKAKIEEKRNKEKLKNKQKAKSFNQYRLDILDSYKPEIVSTGNGGFYGYYAFLFKNTCFLESGMYGNATYIIPKENWESLSMLSKDELIHTKKVINKVIHNQDWEQEIHILMKKLENK